MGSVSTIYNGVRTWLAGRALMDVAFSNRSTNGLQNKIITAKKDEIEGRLDAIESDLGDITSELSDINENVSDLFTMNNQLFTTSNHHAYKIKNLIFAHFNGTTATNGIIVGDNNIIGFSSNITLRVFNTACSINTDGAQYHEEGITVDNTNHRIVLTNRGAAARYLNYFTIFEITN